MSDTSHFFSFKHYFEIATFVLVMIQTTQNVGMHFLSVSNCFCCTRINVYTKYVAGAFRDQSLGEGRGQKYQRSPFGCKMEMQRTWGKLRRFPPWFFNTKSFKKLTIFRARPGKNRQCFSLYQKCAARRENCYNFHPQIASQTP